jgi:8-oxo-dGTP pyrophosphatase MutT (NUDIX family)
MTTTTMAAGHGADTRRHQVTVDVHLLLTDADQVLFGRRCNTGFADGSWHLPSGHLEAGESVFAALVREAHEEIGVAIDEADIEFVHVMHNSSSGGRAAFFFRVRRWVGEPVNMEPDKCDALAWYPLDALPDGMIDYCRVALDSIDKGLDCSVFGW